jgi:hypothetical protein
VDEKRKLAGKRLHPQIVDMVHHYVVDEKWTNAMQVYRQIEDDLRGKPLGKEVPQDERSIRAWVRKFQSQDSSGTWTLANAEDTDPAAVLTVLAAALDQPGQLPLTVTNGEARLISSLYRTDPAIPPLEALRLARRYLAYGEKGQSTVGLDQYVAKRGWTLPPEEYMAYRARGLFEGVGLVYAFASEAIGIGEAFDATVLPSSDRDRGGAE